MEELDQKKLEIEEPQLLPEITIELLLLSTKKNILDIVCRDFYAYAMQHQENIPPVKHLKTIKGQVTTRKSPCGQGTATWSRYKLFVYGRKFEFRTTHDFLEKVATFLQNNDVEITLRVKS
ncbi:40S ribosomal protein S20 [Trachipleistophora hominis]|uniref:40S ribosomal protein S20 n=1 Tax=Trachipleistophora hominis TaxID=72359 RepID=L7JRH7_TRAHO|nr:40S ribosomal protein S20 [Trachipleistophora hominis]